MKKSGPLRGGDFFDSHCRRRLVKVAQPLEVTVTVVALVIYGQKDSRKSTC